MDAVKVLKRKIKFLTDRINLSSKSLQTQSMTTDECLQELNKFYLVRDGYQELLKELLMENPVSTTQRKESISSRLLEVEAEVFSKELQTFKMMNTRY